MWVGQKNSMLYQWARRGTRSCHPANQHYENALYLSIVCISPAIPEPNPAENVWQYSRQTNLGNRVFQNYADIVERLCWAWHSLLVKPGRFQSITHRNWAFVDQFL